MPDRAPEPAPSTPRPKWDYEGRVVEAMADQDARISVLRTAIAVEMTHGGVIDRIAHEATIIGGWASGDPTPEKLAKIREAAARLDAARDEFIGRMEVALRVAAA